MAQFSVNSQRFDPYKNFKFRVKWDGRYVARRQQGVGAQAKHVGRGESFGVCVAHRVSTPFTRVRHTGASVAPLGGQRAEKGAGSSLALASGRRGPII